MPARSYLPKKLAPVRTCEDCGCPESSVVDSRDKGCFIRRRRKCDFCGVRWSTWESRLRPERVLRRATRDPNVGLALKQVRLMLGVTQKQLAKRLPCSYTHVSRMERGEATPSPNVLVAYSRTAVSHARALDVMEDLLEMET